jgi:hypothetical protein
VDPMRILEDNVKAFIKEIFMSVWTADYDTCSGWPMFILHRNVGFLKRQDVS